MADASLENQDIQNVAVPAVVADRSDHSTPDISMEISEANEEDSFIWQDYLDVTHTSEVPQILFSHVEESLTSILQVGMLLEVPLQEPGQFWVASIVMVCGPLLRMRYAGQDDDRKLEFWCDLTKVTTHPIGWCEENHIQYTVPNELEDKLSDPQNFIRNVIHSATRAPAEVLNGGGLIPIERISSGMKLEVQDELNPYNFWSATILENIGGRLFLRYDTPGSLLPDFWLFYASPRLYPIGWVAEKGLPLVLKRPASIANNYSDDEWAAIDEMAKEDARRVPLPSDMFQHDVPSEPHEFMVGMKLEALHPRNMNELCPATVTRVFDSFYFLVQIDSHNDSGTLSWLCTVRHPYIFPVGWAQEHDLHLVHPPGWTSEFTWTKYLAGTLSQAAPKSTFFKHTSARKAGFKQGMKLEVVNPKKPNQICASTIIKTMEHLIWVSIESNDSAHPGYIMSIDSLEIFPVGWCDSNSFPLQPPRFYQIPAKPVKNVEVESESSTTRRSTWCPKIYFNHRCFSGRFLCKGKLAKLPKSVGPGPVTLVIREVLSMLISIAYKSSRVLKVLQVNGIPERGLHCEAFKAKFKTNAYSANISMVTSADKVPAFCKDVCRRLQVCPNLFGLSLFSENCPEKCTSLSKSRFAQYIATGKRGRPKGDISNIVRSRKRKRGRKLLASKEPNSLEQLPVITQEDFTCLLALAGVTKSYKAPAASNDLASCNPTPKASTDCITSATRIKRRYKKKVVPLTQIKTRGAKLPNYSKHWSRKGGWKRLDLRKRVTTVFSTSEEQSSVIRRKGGVKAQVPVRKQTSQDAVKLDSDPRLWTERDVFRYLTQTDDCANIAQLCRDELIDGYAFMLLNLPTMRDHMHLKMEQALKLCHHVEQIKLAFYLQYNNDYNG